MHWQPCWCKREDNISERAENSEGREGFSKRHTVVVVVVWVLLVTVVTVVVPLEGAAGACACEAGTFAVVLVVALGGKAVTTVARATGAPCTACWQLGGGQRRTAV